jgi:aconitate hydratase
MHLNNPFNTLKKLPKDQSYYYSLIALEEQEKCDIHRLPVSIRIMLESLLRNCDGKKVKEEDVQRLARWSAKEHQDFDVPFVVSRVILQDFTGVPLLVDLAAMRDAMAVQGMDAKDIEPQVPVDLVIDHSVQVDRSGSEDSFLFNLKMEFARNQERYEFLKWGQEAFKTFKVVPPGIGIVHQVNLEHIATVITCKKDTNLLFLDTLVGTDSHTTMINGLGVLGWGVGGIEAEAAMLLQPVYLQRPEVIGVHLEGQLKEGVTATDLTLYITEMLRQEKVVGKFVEFFGSGAASLTVADRATIANMAPEYGATIGFFPVDEKTLEYLRITGREEDRIQLIKEYLIAQKLFGIPSKGEIDFTKVIDLNLGTINSCVSGPKRPQDRIDLSNLKTQFTNLLYSPITSGGYGIPLDEKFPKICVHPDGVFSLKMTHQNGGKPYLKEAQKIGWSEEEMVTNRPLNPSVGPPVRIPLEKEACDLILTHGSIVIAAITSCTNTSNPSVMIAAGLLAKKAVERGLKVNSKVKTSLAPGSRVVTDYLEKTGLQVFLNQLGFELVAYGCTTCIGNSGPLDEKIEGAIKDYDLVSASVLSGNRNFEARIHGSVKANFLMSPPLVVAFALAGRVDINMETDSLGNDKNGQPVFLRDIWPTSNEIQETMKQGIQPAMYKKRYAHILDDNPVWQEIKTTKSSQYTWDSKSTYIQHPPYFDDFTKELPLLPVLKEMRVLAAFGDSVTTDHISPAGVIRADSPAGSYLKSLGVKQPDFNSYGSRRGNHLVMMRGTFANPRIRNKLANGKEGGYTKLMPDGKIMQIFEACEVYAERNVPLIIFAGKDYGMGSSRDWAAKGTALLGVKAVVARSFERIHRSNLIGMGVLPLQFQNEYHKDFEFIGEELFSIIGKPGPQKQLILEISHNNKTEKIPLLCRIDTASEMDYYTHGGILPFVLRELFKKSK